MKIFEVTAKVQEAAPAPAGGFSWGDFARGVGGDLMSIWTGVDKPGGKPWFAKPEPPPETKAARVRIAAEIAKRWPATVSQVMSRTRNTTTGITGVTDFNLIDKRQLSMETNNLISQVLKQITNGAVSNISDIPNLKTKEPVTKSIDPAKSAAYVDRIDNKIRTALNGLMVSDPSDPAGKQRMTAYWQEIVNAGYLINQIQSTPDAGRYGLAGRKIARDARGNITLDGRVLNITNPADAAIINDMATQGLLPP